MPHLEVTARDDTARATYRLEHAGLAMMEAMQHLPRTWLACPTEGQPAEYMLSAFFAIYDPDAILMFHLTILQPFKLDPLSYAVGWNKSFSVEFFLCVVHPYCSRRWLRANPGLMPWKALLAPHKFRHKHKIRGNLIDSSKLNWIWRQTSCSSLQFCMRRLEKALNNFRSFHFSKTVKCQETPILTNFD